MANSVTKPEKHAVRQEQREDRTDRRAWLQPQVNIVENSDRYLLEAEMPGVSKEGLEVLLEGNEVTIVGRRSHAPEQAQLIYRESHDRDFRRSFELDPTIDTNRISARMEDGVLYLEFPKAEKVKPRKISVE
jgi:HSP20 family protein